MTKEVIKKGEASLIALNLIIGVIAFAVLIGLSAPVVSGRTAVSGVLSGEMPLAPGGNPAIFVKKGAMVDSAGFVEGYSTTRADWIAAGKPEVTYGKTLQDAFGLSPQTGGLGVLQAFIWAGYAMAIVQVVGGLIGLEEGQLNAATYAAGGGVLTGRLATMGLQSWSTSSGWAGNTAIGELTWGGVAGIGVGAAVAIAIYVFTNKETEYETVYFNCYPWEAPKGGDDCEICNDEDKECSEYRCKSLGQACELLNQDSDGEEMCVWVNHDDVSSPTIEPLYDTITEGYKYANVVTRPPEIGMEIQSTSGGCVEAYTPLEFGINTSEPTQCKIDYDHTDDYENMSFYVGGSNLYSYEHTEQLNLPDPDTILEELQIENDGEFTLYIRCSDANGNYNQDEFAVRFCVESGPDMTPPSIEETSIINGMPVQDGVDEVDITVYVNEPANCRWSKSDQSYNTMENSMTCSTNVWEMEANTYYACSDTLTGIEDEQENVFYFRCKDQPNADEGDRNQMATSYPFTLIGTQPLTIDLVGPNGTISGATSTVDVELIAETGSGYNEGEAWCEYSPTEDEEDYVLFYDTESYTHSQTLSLTEGEYTYYFKCTDLGGNTAFNETTFEVEVDTAPPVVVRAYKYSDALYLITNEDATCVYSVNTVNKCNYDFDEGTTLDHVNPTSRAYEHFTAWDIDNTYYIKCQDMSGLAPNPEECSIVLKPSELV